MKLLIRWAIAAAALWVAAWLVPGIEVDGSGIWLYAAMAIILGLVNALVRPVMKFLSCPLILLTAGLFVLVINALSLWLASWIAQNWFHVSFVVHGFWAAFLGSLILSIVTVILTAVFKED